MAALHARPISKVPTRFDIHADSGRKTADIKPRCQMEIIMNKILIAATLALVASSPLAFAAKTTTPPPASALTT